MRSLILILMVIMAGSQGVIAGSFDDIFNLPKLPPPERYGSILITRSTSSSTHPPVFFSHWSHRQRYICRVCHFELNFAMKTNATEITEAKMRKGEYCAGCHNNAIAFGISEKTCNRCHTGTIGSLDAQFSALNRLPKAPYGNKINWSLALKKKMITPKKSIFDDKFEAMPFDRMLRLEPEWAMVSNTYAVFPHKNHTDWLDCADCHPDVFNIQKKGTRHFRMNFINKSQFCGVCHLTVAFPIQDCKRCHPSLD